MNFKENPRNHFKKLRFDEKTINLKGKIKELFEKYKEVVRKSLQKWSFNWVKQGI